jgi:hypothetical protein
MFISFSAASVTSPEDSSIIYGSRDGLVPLKHRCATFSTCVQLTATRNAATLTERKFLLSTYVKSLYEGATILPYT